MTLQEFVKGYNDFNQVTRYDNEKTSFFREVIQTEPASVIAQHQIIADDCFDSVFNQNEEGMYTYNPVEVDCIIDTILVRLYTDLEFGGENIIADYDLIKSIELAEWIKSINHDASLFHMRLYEAFQCELKLRNSTAAVINRHMKTFANTVVDFVDKIQSYDITPETLAEVTDVLKNINSTVEEVKGITG